MNKIFHFFLLEEAKFLKSIKSILVIPVTCFLYGACSIMFAVTYEPQMLIVGMLVKFIFISALAYFYCFKMFSSLKTGKIKGYLMNGFSKQQYFISHILTAIINILILEMVSIVMINLTWSQQGLPLFNVGEWILFYLFFSLLTPLLLVTFQITIYYFWFKKGSLSQTFFFIIITFVALLIVLMITSLMLSASLNVVISYIVLFLPFGNLCLSVPTVIGLVQFPFWIAYILDVIYIVIVLIIFYMNRPKTSYIVNGNNLITIFKK